MRGEYIIEMVGITKSFPGVKANDNITLRLKKGEIHALLGENGAGKSTLMSVLFGLYKPDKGVVKKNGTVIKLADSNDARAFGIGMVHQHFNLINAFTAFENIILGAEPTKFGFIRRRNEKKKIKDLCARYSLHIDLDKRIDEINVGMQQRVEIVKMLYCDNEILIFDEPTSVLTPQESNELMRIMQELAKNGKTILFISHKLSEIMAVSDRISVMRKGKLIGTVEAGDITKEELSLMMMGRAVNFAFNKERAQTNHTVMKVENLSVIGKSEKASVKNASFYIKGGEIVAVAGVEGNGQSELIKALTGLCKISSGRVLLFGEDITEYSGRKKMNTGIRHIPEDAVRNGLVKEFSLENNCVLMRYFESDFQRSGFIKSSAVREYAEALIEKYGITADMGAMTVTDCMSGGNQQKVVVARELDRNQSLIIAVHPTKGLDVGATESIYRELLKKRNEGKAVLLVSYELDEIMNIADRILVIYQGEITGELYPAKTTVSELGLYMSGVKRK